MKKSLQTYLQKLCDRIAEINALLTQEETLSNISYYTQLNKELAEIIDVSSLYENYKQMEQDLSDAEEMTKDPEMKDLAISEVLRLKKALEDEEIAITKQLTPKDPNDHCNVYLEIRAGTGGSESALFSADLLRMYWRFAERNQWQIEIVSQSPSDIGGYKEVVAKITGYNVYSQLKFESGAHRVQRIPLTESRRYSR